LIALAYGLNSAWFPYSGYYRDRDVDLLSNLDRLFEHVVILGVRITDAAMLGPDETFLSAVESGCFTCQWTPTAAEFDSELLDRAMGTQVFDLGDGPDAESIRAWWREVVHPVTGIESLRMVRSAVVTWVPPHDIWAEPHEQYWPLPNSLSAP
jgi:hypothetical protein